MGGVWAGGRGGALLLLLASATVMEASRYLSGQEDAEDTCRDNAKWCRKLGGRIPLVRCYRKERRCCQTCRRLKLPIAGCQYGDREAWCDTLGVDKPISECYKHNSTCCQTCALYNTGHPTCPYGDRESWCSAIGTRYVASSCYEYQDTCCDTCNRYRSDMPDCPYGDRLTWCGGIGKYFSLSHCVTNKDTCCMTCHRLAMANTTTAAPSTTTTTTTTTSPATAVTVSTTPKYTHVATLPWNRTSHHNSSSPNHNLNGYVWNTTELPFRQNATFKDITPTRNQSQVVNFYNSTWLSVTTVVGKYTSTSTLPPATATTPVAVLKIKDFVGGNMSHSVDQKDTLHPHKHRHHHGGSRSRHNATHRQPTTFAPPGETLVNRNTSHRHLSDLTDSDNNSQNISDSIDIFNSTFHLNVTYLNNTSPSQDKLPDSKDQKNENESVNKMDFNQNYISAFSSAPSLFPHLASILLSLILPIFLFLIPRVLCRV